MDSRCRICLTVDNLNEVFPESGRIPTANQIHLTTGIQISETCDLPKFVCNSCIVDIQNAVQLRIKASESDVKLRQIYETDVFNREIKSEPVADYLFAVKSEPNEDLDAPNPVFSSSVCWPLNEESKPEIKSKRTNLKLKVKIPKPPKQEKPPKLTKLPRTEKSAEQKIKAKSSRYHFVCSLCGQLCRQRSVFEEHMFRHEDSRPFICHYCNHTFSYKRSLIRHMIIHRDVKLYQCDLCTNSYRNRHNLIYHKINTHGTEAEKKFKCICGKAFAFNYLLKIHATKYCKGPVEGPVGILNSLPQPLSSSYDSVLNFCPHKLAPECVNKNKQNCQ